jgi:hypothetical protein
VARIGNKFPTLVINAWKTPSQSVKRGSMINEAVLNGAPVPEKKINRFSTVSKN